MALAQLAATGLPSGKGEMIEGPQGGQGLCIWAKEDDGNVVASKRLLCTLPSTSFSLSPLNTGLFFFFFSVKALSAELIGLITL